MRLSHERSMNRSSSLGSMGIGIEGVELFQLHGVYYIQCGHMYLTGTFKVRRVTSWSK